MYCPRCGAENDTGSKYCASCGAELARQEKVRSKDSAASLALRERIGGLIGGDRRARIVTLGTVAAILVAVVAFLALGSANEGADVPQDPYTRALDASCIQRKSEIAAAQRRALGGAGLATVSRYADAIVPIAGEWRLELNRGQVPPDRLRLVEALRVALLEVQIEAGALARVARESDPDQVARRAAQVDAATANVESAVASLGLAKCAEITVSRGRLVRQ